MVKIKAVLLAAGYATRLHPLTINKPKPLLEIAGKPVIEHILSRVEEIDSVDEIFIVTNNKFYGNFIEWLKHRKLSKKIKVINDKTKSDEERLGAIGDINFVVKTENIDNDTIVIGGDNLFEFSLVKLYEFFQEKNASVVALFDIVNKNKASKKYGVVEVDNDMKIIGFEEKPETPKSSLISTACYIFFKEDIKELERCIKEHKQPDNLGNFIKYLANKKNVYGFVFNEKWFDIGSEKELKEADIFWRKK